MEHDEAIKNLTAERYLLGELNVSDRDAYEEHLFSCPACFEQVKAGSEFVGHLRRTGVEGPKPAPGFMPRLVASFRQPATITALGLAVIVSGIALHQNTVIARLKGPGPEIRSVLVGIAHGDSPVKVVEATRNSRLSLNVDYARSGEFLSYEAQLLSSSGRILHTVPLLAKVGTVASISVPAEALEPGQYSMIVFGRRSDGSQEEIGRGAFELKFMDR
jgi:hypothetical protein